ncbi:MarR family winged helix-turn-helix transcriptional regulator [Rhizobium sp. RU36D]|uniref:MarR family winged helix-turn-helix transcriptional regulator n=1 Tax=Rhizobium sp. RU36D TaxID=1907415 RepID=UPI0009D8F974|nr:MarR family winged helix-turn-helix transcriptional regulator [Rhizobium sp. RU36D]SMC76110.1 DNA-binding transcriptional regulator, MarR family [Rhizobium sp. RU36D]
MTPSNGPSKGGDATAAETCPEGRISSSITTRDGVEILDISNYIPFFLSSINNALSRGASAIYRERFGIGISEWRTISMLAIEPEITAARICEVVNLDKAAASRALATLDEMGYLGSVSAETDPRKRTWWLNDKGYELHATIIEIALAREKALIEGVDPQDLEAAIRAMRIMMSNVRRM